MSSNQILYYFPSCQYPCHYQYNLSRNNMLQLQNGCNFNPIINMHYFPMNMPIYNNYTSNLTTSDINQGISNQKLQFIKENSITQNSVGIKIEKKEEKNQEKEKFISIIKKPGDFQMKSKYKQSETRNIITNVGSKLMTFISKKSKSLTFLKKFYPQIQDKEIENYYQYVSSLRKEVGNYLTLQKMKIFWFQRSQKESNEKFKKIIRQISYIYLNQIFVLQTLNSKRIRKNFKFNHLQARVKLIWQLKNE